MTLLWLLVLFAADAAKPPSEPYLECLGHQQLTYDLSDARSEDCMATILYEKGWRRLARSLGGGLDVWLAEYDTHQKLADSRYPLPTGSWPETLRYRPEPAVGVVGGWAEGSRRPFRGHALSPMVAQTLHQVSQAGVSITPGEPIRWSRRYRRKHPFPMTSRLLVTLAFARTSFLLRTGHEDALFTWILAQPDSSITVPDLLARSITLCGGDVRVALLTIENLLSRHFMAPERDRLLHVAKLRPITNTWGHRGDRFGSWYHLFGMILYTYEHGAPKGAWVASVESIGSRYSEPGVEERQEAFINKAGARMGAILRRQVGDGIAAGQGVKGHSPDPRWLLESSYLDLGEYGAWRSPFWQSEKRHK